MRLRPLFTGLAVALLVLTGLLGEFIVSLLPEPPEVRFVTFRDSYHLGEFVAVRVENHDSTAVWYASSIPWTIDRLVGPWDWQPVVEPLRTRSIHTLEPGESDSWGWFAKDSQYRERKGWAEVLPGEYRFHMAVWPDESSPREYFVLHAYFRLVA